jgi:MFS family permease
LDKITLVTTTNYLVQLMVDFLAVKYIDKIGYRVSIVASHIFSATGLIGLAIFPGMFGNAYVGIMLAVILYAIGGGITEVLISPIVEACPTKKKEAAMSLLHSFYCWGHVGVVIISTLFFTMAGIENWRILAIIWAIIPIFNCFYFAVVPLYPIVAEHEKMSLKGLIGQKIFWVLMLFMIGAGASEAAMSLWASAFAESALNVSKTVGDLAGPCAFAVLMGIARAGYGNNSDKIPLKKMMIGSACLCMVCYLIAGLSQNPIFGLIGCAVCGFSVGIFWPGTFSLAALKLPTAGTAMYAFMALAGDVGCSAGPTLVGFVANANQNNLQRGLLLAVVFPVMILAGMWLLRE